MQIWFCSNYDEKGMRMEFGIGGLTSSVVGLALDGLAVRHDAIASNIANINTPGYRPVKVSFEEQLANLISAGASKSPQDVANISPRVSYTQPTTAASSERRLDMNTVLLNQNTLQYQVLISGLEKYMSNIALATNDGRR